jgi:hypothetical protein
MPLATRKNIHSDDKNMYICSSRGFRV